MTQLQVGISQKPPWPGKLELHAEATRLAALIKLDAIGVGRVYEYALVEMTETEYLVRSRGYNESLEQIAPRLGRRQVGCWSCLL